MTNTKIKNFTIQIAGVKLSGSKGASTLSIERGDEIVHLYNYDDVKALYDLAWEAKDWWEQNYKEKNNGN